MEETKKPLESLITNSLKAVGQLQTYKNIIYLFLSFPLGIFYFVFFTTMISLGIGLLPIVIGLPILILVFILAKKFMLFEGMLAKAFLGIEVTPRPRISMDGLGLLQRIKAEVNEPESWKSLVFMFLKFPLGIFSFVVAVTLCSLSLGLLSAPFVYSSINESIHVDIFANDAFFYLFPGHLTSMEKSMVYFTIGLVVFPLCLNLMNYITKFIGKLTEKIL